MRIIKIYKCLCLFLLMICSVLDISSLPAFAYENNGNTEVIAHIEASSKDQDVDEHDSNVTSSDEKSVETGNTASSLVITNLILLVISIFVIYLFGKHLKTKK